jgi:hypothetical protein
MSSGRITSIRGTRGVPVAVTALREEHSPSSPSASDPPTTGSAGSGGHTSPARQSDNPFAAPPKGTPDRPWQPRHNPSGGDGQVDGDGRDTGDRWSSRQPAPYQGGPRDPFGGARPGVQRPERRPGPGGPGGPGAPQGRGPSFDVTDPVQRRARYSLMAGTAGLFFGLYGLPEIALLLGALALYWGVSALRGKAKPPADPVAAAEPRAGADLSAWQSPRTPDPAAGTGAARVPARGPQGPQAAWGTPPAGPYRPHFGAAVCGTIAAGLTLALVATAFTLQLVYKSYYTCVNDALTSTARAACATELPGPIRSHMTPPQDG